MYNNLKFLCLFFISVNFAQNDLAKVTYEVNLEKQRIENTSEKFSESKNEALKMLKESSPVNALLYFNKQRGLYVIENKLKSDSQKQINFIEMYAGNDSKYYTDLSKTYNITQTDATGTTSRIYYEPKEWILTKEKKKIDNYLCFKAILKNKPSVSAWYTLDIPIGHGPRGYNGLPGLILELHLNKYYWIVRKIEFGHKDAKHIIEPTEGKLISEKEFREYSEGIFGKN